MPFLKIFISVFLILTSALSAKTQQFEVVFKGIVAGQATLTLPDVLTFPVLGSDTKQTYRVTLQLKPNTLANLVGVDDMLSTSVGSMTATQTLPNTFTQKENGKLVIKGVFSDKGVRVTDLPKRKERYFSVPKNVHDPLSLILQLQQDIRAKTRANEYLIVDEKRLNLFSVQRKMNAKKYSITLTSKNDNSIFIFDFNIALDLIRMTKYRGKDILYSLQAD